MLEPVASEDLPAIRALIEAAIRDSVAQSDEEAAFLIDDIGSSLEWWQLHAGRALHLKYVRSGELAGVVLVKDYWNLTNLFVHPRFQSQGIGRELIARVLEVCRDHSPRSALLVNSSTNAVGFYRRMGFTQTGPGKDRPGGCVPFCYTF